MKKSVKILILALIFVSLLAFCYTFPYSGDDWAFATTYGNIQLKEFFKNLNGRYLGNILAIIISRNNIIKTIYMSIVIFLIIYFSTKLIKKDNTILMIIFYILFLTMNNSIFAQSIIWSSGFCNYATASLFMILILYFCLNKINFKYSVVIYFLLSFLGSLLVENMTLALFGFALIINIRNYFKTRKINYNYLALLLGSILGLLIMFLNPSYLKILNKADNYRSLEQTNLEKMMFPYLFFNPFLNLLKIITILFVVFKKPSVRNIIIGSAFNIFIIILMFYEKLPNILIFVILYCIVGGLFLFVNRKIINKNLKIIFTLIVLTIIPLFFVNPIGARNFLPIYLLELIFYLSLISDYLIKFKFNYLIIFTAIIVYGFTYYIYNVDFKATEVVRNQLITKINEGQKEINVNLEVFEKNKVHYPLPYLKGDKVAFSEFYHTKKGWTINYNNDNKSLNLEK